MTSSFAENVKCYGNRTFIFYLVPVWLQFQFSIEFTDLIQASFTMVAIFNAVDQNMQLKRPNDFKYLTSLSWQLLSNNGFIIYPSPTLPGQGLIVNLFSPHYTAWC